MPKCRPLQHISAEMYSYSQSNAYDMILYGASGHARVIRDIIEAMGEHVSCLVDDNPDTNELDGLPVVHRLQADEPVILSIGSNRVRKLLDRRHAGTVWGRAIHPSAIVSPSAQVDEGSVVMQGAILQAGTRIGRHCIVNTGAAIDHECQIGDFVHISPHATLCGNVHVGEGSWVGAGSTVIQGIHIGRDCIIGAGSVVTRNIPDGYVAYGNPCHIRREA